MKKLDETVRKETLYIAAWTLILSAVMQSVFLVAGLWSFDVLFANLISAFCAVLNFLLMGITVQKAVAKGDSEEAVNDAAQLMRFSQSIRMFMMLAIAAVAAYFFHPVAAVIPLFFPRIAVTFRPLFDKRKKSEKSEDSE